MTSRHLKRIDAIAHELIRDGDLTPDMLWPDGVVRVGAFAPNGHACAITYLVVADRLPIWTTAAAEIIYGMYFMPSNNSRITFERHLAIKRFYADDSAYHYVIPEKLPFMCSLLLSIVRDHFLNTADHSYRHH